MSLGGAGGSARQLIDFPVVVARRRRAPTRPPSATRSPCFARLLAELDADRERAVAFGVVDEPRVRRRDEAAVAARDRPILDRRAERAVHDAVLAATREVLRAIDDGLPRRERRRGRRSACRDRDGSCSSSRRRVRAERPSRRACGAGGIDRSTGFASRRAALRRRFVALTARRASSDDERALHHANVLASSAILREVLGIDVVERGELVAVEIEHRDDACRRARSARRSRCASRHRTRCGRGTARRRATSIVRRSAAAVPHTPRPNAMRTHATLPWNGPSTSSSPCA